MVLELYYKLGDPTTMLVEAVLNKFQITYEWKEVTDNEEAKVPEEITRFAPELKLPALLDDGFAVVGDRGILRYIIQSREINDKFYPLDDLKTKSTINSYLDHEQMAYRLPFRQLMTEYKENPSHFKKEGFKDEKTEELYKKVAESLDKMLEILDRNPGPFILGDTCTLADFAYFFTTFQAVEKANVSLNKHKEVKEWYDKVKLETKV